MNNEAGAIVILTCLTLGAAGAAAQPVSLDTAVRAQLDNNCRLLLEDDSPGVLRPPLHRLCFPPIPGTPPVGTVSGGSAASPVSAIEHQRLREQVLAAAESDSTAASGDSRISDLGGLTLFAVGGYGVTERERSPFEDGYDSRLVSAGIGGSYQVRPDLWLGASFDYLNEDGDFDGGGDFTIRSFGFTTFGTFRAGRVLVLDVMAGYARQSNERTRPVAVDFTLPGFDEPVGTIAGIAAADYDANVFRAAAAASSNLWLGGFTLLPRAAVSWSHIVYEAYAETPRGPATGLELRFGRDRENSVISSVGLGVARVFSLGALALVPRLDISWLHELANDRRTIEVNFVGDRRGRTFGFQTEEPDRDFVLLAAGLTLVLPHGLRPFVQAQTLLAHRFLGGHAVTLGLSYDF